MSPALHEVRPKSPEALKSVTYATERNLSHQLWFGFQFLGLGHKGVISRYFQSQWAVSIAIEANRRGAYTYECVDVLIKFKVL